MKQKFGKKLKRVNKSLSLAHLLQKVLKFVALRPRSRQEILDYLRKKNPKDDSLRKKVLEEIESLGLIDDREFAFWWIEQRATFRPKGKKALLAELKQKGLEENLIKEVISEKVDEFSLAQKLVEKRWPSLKKMPLALRQQKLTGWLVQRGFSWETIKAILDEIFKKK